MKAPIISKGDRVRCNKFTSDHAGQMGTVLCASHRATGTFIGFLVKWDDGEIGTYQRSHLIVEGSTATTAAFLAWWFSHPRAVILGDTLVQRDDQEVTFTITTTRRAASSLLEAAWRSYAQAADWGSSFGLRQQLAEPFDLDPTFGVRR